MLHFFTYLGSAFSVLIGIMLFKLSYRGVDGERVYVRYRHIQGAIALFIIILSASPMVYEYPNKFEESNIVLEITDSGKFIEHPYGMFGIEGISPLITVPARGSKIPLFSAVRAPLSETGEAHRLYYSGGYITVTDYTRLLAQTADLEAGSEGLSEMKSVICRIANDCYDTVVSRTPQLLELNDPESKEQQEEFCSLLEKPLNALLAERGLTFQATEFWQ